MKIALVTDAWAPQVNGVVTTLMQVTEALERDGDEVHVLHPGLFRSVPCPSYPEIRLAVMAGRELHRRLSLLDAEAVHIATEGPLGMSARRWCLRHDRPFTTAYHTQFPRYLRLRAPVPESWTYAWLRRFHGAATRCMVATPAVQSELQRRGFRNVVPWSRGVDTALFRPRDKDFLPGPRPIHLYMGRVSVEKNIQAFLDLELPGSRYVVGGGPDLARLQQRYPDVRFTGFRQGEELARTLAAADVFVFPSRTDTFGLVMLEAMACGVPVAAYPVTGPLDVVDDGVTGALHEDLGVAVRRALRVDPAACLAHACRHTWQRSARQFRAHLEPVVDTLPLAG